MANGIQQYLQVDAATLGALKYQGVWNASTNTPTLTSGVGVQGQYYVVSVAGTTNLDGETNWGVGDWAVFNGTVWQKVDGGSTGNLTTLTVTGNTYLATTSGSVGIGTASPAVPLEVIGQTTVDGAATGAATGTFLVKGAKTDSQGFKFTFNNSTNLADITNFYSGALTLGTNNLERVRIDSSGNVGIGTSSPSALLETRKDTNATVNELIRLRNDGTGNGGGVSINFTQGTTSTGYVRNWYSGSWRTDIGSYQNITFSVGVTPAEVARLDSSGNLGLGVTPSAWGAGFKAAQLTYGSLYSQAFTVVGSAANAYNNGTNWIYYSTGQAVSRYEQSQGAHSWHTAAAGTVGNAITFTQAMTLDASGQLGIGTSSPRNPGAGYQGITLNGSNSGFLDINTNGTRVLTLFGIGNDVSITNPTATGTLQFLTNNTERLRITSAGNIHTPAGATTMTNGFFYIPAAAGIPTGAPTAITGTVPMYYDTTNNKFYVYNGAWKSVALL